MLHCLIRGGSAVCHFVRPSGNEGPTRARYFYHFAVVVLQCDMIRDVTARRSFTVVLECRMRRHRTSFRSGYE